MTALAAAILTAMLAAETPTAAPVVDAALQQKIAQLIDGLGSDKFATREASMDALAAVGEPAIPLLEKHLNDADLEVRRRAQTAITMIRWHISPDLRKRIGNLMDGFEKLDYVERERIVRALAAAGEKLAIPSLARIIEQEKHHAVWLAAVWALFDMAPEGELALAQLGVTQNWPERLDVGIRIRLGNSLLEDGQYDKAIEQYSQAIKKDPDNEVLLYNMACAHSRKKNIEQALDWLRKAIDAGYDDADWMDKDADLDNIREHPRYKQMLQELRVKERLGPKGDRPRT
jgi:tetratricopeptide (TPR) repeat protein